MRTALKFREKKRDSSSLVNVLHKSCNYAFSRTVKKFTKKRDARAKSLFFSITYCFFDVLVAVAVVVAKTPYLLTDIPDSLLYIFSPKNFFIKRD